VYGLDHVGHGRSDGERALISDFDRSSRRRSTAGSSGRVLWQHGEADQLVPVEGSRRTIELFTNADVTRHIYPGARHEIINETNRQEVLGDTTRFIEAAVAPDRA
jgi:alpha-beta hydrolase superfamily lysophospholipase